MTRGIADRVAVVFVLTAMTLSACGVAQDPARAPRQILDQYVAALEQRRFDAAYRLMSADFRKRYTEEEFSKIADQAPAAFGADLKQLARAGDRLRLGARLTYGSDERIDLVWQQGAWRIDSDPGAFYSQSSPRAALRSFVRAAEHRRYDLLLRFVPKKWASEMTAAQMKERWEGPKRQEIEELVRLLKAHLSAPIRRDKDRATMVYGERHQARLIREDGIWKIEDPD